MSKFLSKLLLLLVLIFIGDRLVGGFLKVGLEKYLGLDKDSEIVCVGHSHTMLGIDNKRLEQGLGVSVSQYALNGANVFDRETMVQHYFDKYPVKGKVVVYDVDAYLFDGAGLSSNSYQLFFPFLENTHVNSYIKARVGSNAEYVTRKLSSSLRFNSTLINLSARGHLGVYDNLKHGLVDIKNLQNEIQTGRRVAPKVDPDYLAEFKKTIASVTGKGGIVVLVFIPTVDVLNNIDVEAYKKVVRVFKAISGRNISVYYLDYNQDFSSRHELFSDPVHVNSKGREIITTELVEDIKRILKNKKVTFKGRKS